MKVSTLSRQEAQDQKHRLRNCAWICIGEPGNKKSIVIHKDFTWPKLEISFWDLTTPVPSIGSSSLYYPPSEYDAQEILVFILENKNKDLVINCNQGRSRSAAIAKFCKNYLGYSWEYGQSRATPNKVLYDHLVATYKSLECC